MEYLTKTLKFPYINHEVEMVIENEVLNYLEGLEKKHLFESLNYIIKEVAGNANKANMKRIHFRRKNLDINNEREYEEGITNFQEELNEKFDLYFNLAKQLGFFVKINLYIEDNTLIVLILDNSPLLPVEVIRIREKFKNAARFQTLEQVFAEGLDLTEGGGFGLIMIILMLRKIGLDEKVLKIMKSDKFTSIKIEIPLNLVSPVESEIIAGAIAKEINEIPQFPPHVLELQRILGDPNADFRHLSHIIEKDPTLIADILKTANSVMYALPHRVHDIEEAVKMIGFKGVQNLILTYTTQHLLMNRYRLDVIQEIMNHSAEVAFYANEIARWFQQKQSFEVVYVGGILHDIGKIMINALKPKMLDRIKKICRERGLNQNLMEELTNGYNHSIIGGKLAAKWNFPDPLVQIIRYHHVPTEAKEELFPMVASVNLADNFYYYRRKQANFSDVNYQVRKYFNFATRQDYEFLFQKVLTSFKKKVKKWNEDES